MDGRELDLSREQSSIVSRLCTANLKSSEFFHLRLFLLKVIEAKNCDGVNTSTFNRITYLTFVKADLTRGLIVTNDQKWFLPFTEAVQTQGSNSSASHLDQFVK